MTYLTKYYTKDWNDIISMHMFCINRGWDLKINYSGGPSLMKVSGYVNVLPLQVVSISIILPVLFVSPVSISVYGFLGNILAPSIF